MSTQTKPVLLVGGSGIVGAETARLLRRRQPRLPITVAGRNLGRASRIADDIGNADATKVDLERADLGLSSAGAYSAIAMFVKDDTLSGLKYAQAHGLPYVSISSGFAEIAPEVARYVHQPAGAPILLDSLWLAGAAALPTLHFAAAFRTIDTIEIGAVLDEDDMGGPAAYADFERLTKAGPHALILEDGKWIWAHGPRVRRRLTTVDGTEVQAEAYSPLDVFSLAAATDARSIRFDLVVGQTASRRRGEPLSTEIVVEITGVRNDGSTGRDRYELVHPAGQAPVTALGVALTIERLIGLADGPAVAPGLYLPEVLIDPAYMVQQLKELGTEIRGTRPALVEAGR